MTYKYYFQILKVIPDEIIKKTTFSSPVRLRIVVEIRHITSELSTQHSSFLIGQRNF